MAQGLIIQARNAAGVRTRRSKLSIVKRQYIAAADPCLYGWYVIAHATINLDGFVVTPDFALLDRYAQWAAANGNRY